MSSAEKRRFLIIFIAGILAIVLFFFNIFRDKTNIKEINEQLDIAELQFLMKETELSMDYVQKGGCFGCNPYQSKDNGIELAFSGYPDMSDRPQVLTRIVTIRSDDSVYGIHVGMKIEEAVSILKKYGIKQIDYMEKVNYVDFKRSKLNVSLKHNSQKEIEEISITLSSRGKWGVSY
jgi:hypothetical protein